MSDSFDEFTHPFDLIQIFPEGDQEELTSDDIYHLSRVISLQSTADGRLFILINHDIARIQDLLEECIQRFENSHSTITLQLDDQEPFEYTPQLSFDDPERMLTMRVFGMIYSTIIFKYSNNQNDYEFYPLICIGLPKPPMIKKFQDDFDHFLATRNFPLQDPMISKKRLSAERANREFLVQINNMKQEFKKRQKNAKETILKCEHDLIEMQQQIENLESQNASMPKAAIAIEKKIKQFEETIKSLEDLCTTVEQLYEEKAQPKEYTKEEELELLEELRKAVFRTRDEVNSVLKK